ncbi:MAG: exo-alpha-sialidase [Candidatus Hydrogenedentota bacterium]
MKVILLLGTRKGLFVAESDARRESWEIRGPLISGTWAILNASLYPFPCGPETTVPTIFAGGASNWYGAAVWRSRDLGATWTHSSEGLTYGDEGPEIRQIWCVTPSVDSSGRRVLYAGVEPAGLFRSEDDGDSWIHVAGLRAHPSRSAWRATAGGMCLHAIVPHPIDPLRIWVGISSGGVFHTGDEGRTWNRCDAVPDDPLHPMLHPCVHALALADAQGRDLDPRLYQRNHDGVYRSDDGGVSWRDISAGLPSRFGFPLAVHPRLPETLYVVPLESDQPGRRIVPGGRMAVWRSRDAGAHWQALSRGLPQDRASLSVLRGALALDALDPAGVYVGTKTGQVYWSIDEGDLWKEMPFRLPPIYSIAVDQIS